MTKFDKLIQTLDTLKQEVDDGLAAIRNICTTIDKTASALRTIAEHVAEQTENEILDARDRERQIRSALSDLFTGTDQ